MSTLIRALLRTTTLTFITLLFATTMRAAFCAPPSPPQNDTQPNPDNPPSCGPRQCERCTASPCFAKTGVYVTSATDLQVPTNGSPLVAARSYESSQLVDGALGYGWRSNFGARLYYATYLLAAPSTFSKEAIVVMPDGESYRFRENTDGSFAAPTGRRDVLVKLADSTFQLTLEHTNARYAFAADGALLTIKDDYGNTLRFTLDGVRRISRVDDDSGTGRYLTITWNPSGRISSVQDNAGRMVSYSYSTNGTLTGVTNAAGQTTAISYEQRRFAPQLSQIRDHWNRVLADVTWDSLDRVQTFSEGGETYTMSYLPADQFNPARTVKSHSKGSQVITYDANGLVTSRGEQPISYTSTGDILSDGSTQFTYTGDGRIAKVSYGGDVAFHYTYDSTYPDKVAKIEPRLVANATLYHGHWLGWKYTYYTPTDSGSGALPGALKQVERMAFQHQTQTVLTEGDPAALYAQFSYDSRGRVKRTWDRTTLETKYTYDDVARTVSVTRPSNGVGVGERVTVHAFDAVGRLTSETDPIGNVTSYEYDALDRVTKVTLPKPTAASSLDFTTTISYDHAGSTPGLIYTHTTDMNNRLTKAGYDAFGRLVESVDAAGNTTTYAYANGLLGSITDANGNLTSYGYDALRRLSSTTFPDGESETYQYYADGKLSSRTNRKGVTTTFAYDSYGRLTLQTTGTQSRSYTYEGQKLATLADSYSGTTDLITYTYDPKTFLPLSEKQGLGAGTARGTIDYTWTTSADLIATYKVTDADAPAWDTQTVTYFYNSDSSIRRLNWTRGPGSYNFTYDLNGRTTRISFPNGQTRNYMYDSQGRIIKVSNLLDSTTNLATFDYEYDKDNATGAFTVLGQGTSMTAAVPALSSAPKKTEYFYDHLYQLTRARVTTSPTSDRTWTYDAIGNRLTQTINAATTSYAYGQNATAKNTNRLASAGGSAITHDANGNITAIGATTYLWDALDRLKTRTLSSAYQFKYDALNRRIGVDYQSTKFIYQGANVVDMAYQKGAGYYRSNYLFGPGIDEPLARVDNTAVAYYAVDGLGSVILLTDDTGTVKNRYEYGPWGDIRTRTEELTQPFAYTAREFATIDTTSENDYYYRARYTRPAFGRFISEDPLRFESGDNWYDYAANDPIGFTDPLGLSPYMMCESTGDVVMKTVVEERTATPAGPGYLVRRRRRIVQRLCDFRCYCNRPNNCYNRPCWPWCELDHGLDEKLKINERPGQGVRPCKNYISMAIARGAC